MGEAANEAYEGVRDYLAERSAQIERERAEHRQEQIDRAYVEALGFSTCGGFPLPAGGYPGR